MLLFKPRQIIRTSNYDHSDVNSIYSCATTVRISVAILPLLSCLLIPPSRRRWRVKLLVLMFCTYGAGVCAGMLLCRCFLSQQQAAEHVSPLKMPTHTHTHTHSHTEDSAKLDHNAESTSQKITPSLWARLFGITSGSDHISGSCALAYLLSAE